MHIGFRRSGGLGAGAVTGRGEYEVVGSHSGLTAIGLAGWTFNLAWPDGLVRETALGLEPATSGKPRLRSLADNPFQIGRMVAAMLLLPDPRRDFVGVGRNLPVRIVKRSYVLTRLGFGADTEFSPIIDMVTIDPTFVDLEDAGEVLSIGVANRWVRVQRVYDASDDLPYAVRVAVEQHRSFMASGETITSGLVQVVNAIEGALLLVPGTPSAAGHDVLPALEGLLALAPLEGPTLPTPDNLGEDEPEVSARAAVEYRLAKMRGAGARQFSLDVREAYRYGCAFCGLRFGGIPGIPSGVDAAHILAWSKHNLDVVTNGMSLCKLHHWAFDAALLMPVTDAGGTYKLLLTELATALPADARLRLVPSSGMEIPDVWLPADPAHRPSKTYLERLYADLAVTFAA